MACSLTITNVQGLTNTLGDIEDILVNGTANECQNVKVSVNCQNSSIQSSGVAIVDQSGNWSLTLKMPCRCEEKIVVTVSCEADESCQTEFTGILKCRPKNSCPLANIVVTTIDQTDDDVSIDSCNPDGSRTRIFNVNITLPAGVFSVVSYIDYGDLTNSIPYTSTSFSDSHDYSPTGPYTAQLIFVQPENCPPIPIDVGDIPFCCPIIEEILFNVDGCFEEGSSVQVDFFVDISPSSSGSYAWNFNDLSLNPTGSTTGPANSHNFQNSGNFLVEVTFTPDDENCTAVSSSVLVTIPECDPIDEEPPTDEDPPICTSIICCILYGLLIAAIIAFITQIIIALCPIVPNYTLLTTALLTFAAIIVLLFLLKLCSWSNCRIWRAIIWILEWAAIICFIFFFICMNGTLLIATFIFGLIAGLIFLANRNCGWPRLFSLP